MVLLLLLSCYAAAMFDSRYLAADQSFTGFKVFRSRGSQVNHYALKPAISGLCTGQKLVHKKILNHESVWLEFCRQLYPTAASFPIVCCSELQVAGELATNKTGVLNLDFIGSH
jgi:hypothetical protein